ncbi:MAG: hypothetical protein Fur006_21380 [Coleofasciculaceae cyanobacterium]
MFRGIITAFFAGAIVAGLSSTVDAKPRVQSQSQGGYTTRSGASLRGLENRNVSQDFPTFLPETSESSPSSVPTPISIHDNSETVNQPQSITVFGQKIELGHRNSSQNSENQAPSHVGLRNIEVSAGASSLDSQQLLRVQYQMLSSPEQK